jgi:repressor LexA
MKEGTMRLSEKQEAILEFIRDYWRAVDRPPTVREIKDQVRLSSTSVVSYNLDALVRGGFITRQPGVSRGIQLVDEQKPSFADVVARRVPLVGFIGASEPAPVFDAAVEPDEMVDLARDIVPDKKEVYALRVRGDSMVDALVNDGDIVLLEAGAEAHNGDMVAAWLREEQETTLKHFYREGNQVRLQPANPTMKPIYTPAANVDIRGKVIVVIRQVA